MSTVPTILLIADDVDTADDLRRAIEQQGYALAHAPSGADAQAWLRRERRPALILIDWTMPTGEGARFLSRQASDPQLASIPVVVLAEIAQMRSIPTLCVSATLAKPVRPRTLLEVIDVLRAQAEQAAPAPEHTLRLRPAVQRVNTEEMTIPMALPDEIPGLVLDDRTVRTVDSDRHRQ